MIYLDLYLFTYIVIKRYQRYGFNITHTLTHTYREPFFLVSVLKQTWFIFTIIPRSQPSQHYTYFIHSYHLSAHWAIGIWFVTLSKRTNRFIQRQENPDRWSLVVWLCCLQRSAEFSQHSSSLWQIQKNEHNICTYVVILLLYIACYVCLLYILCYVYPISGPGYVSDLCRISMFFMAE